jgi:hypothetical protein
MNRRSGVVAGVEDWKIGLTVFLFMVWLLHIGVQA